MLAPSYCYLRSKFVEASIAVISGFEPCLVFMPLILVESCYFYCSYRLIYFFNSAGFYYENVKLPKRTTRRLSIIHGRFGTTLEVIWLFNWGFLFMGRRRIIMGLKSKRGILIDMLVSSMGVNSSRGRNKLGRLLYDLHWGAHFASPLRTHIHTTILSRTHLHGKWYQQVGFAWRWDWFRDLKTWISWRLNLPIQKCCTHQDPQGIFSTGMAARSRTKRFTLCPQRRYFSSE